MPRKKQYPLREKFLESFVRELIRNSTPKTIEITEMPSFRLTPTKLVKTHSFQKPPRQFRHSAFTPSKKIPPQMPAPPSYQPQIPQMTESLNLGKISVLLKDPSVISVEYPGPGKNVIVNRGGAIQTTAIRMTKEEVAAIMQDISDKTRIPVANGLFRAAYQNLLITAVISEFVGTRFIIHKRMPFRRY